jgi:DNA polymerase/3'-5' exonuclease PolX
MSAGAKMPLARAKRIADGLVKLMAPECHRIEIAGSIRRGKADIGDIEIVAIPRKRFDLLEQPIGSCLDALLENAVDMGVMEKLKGGDKYQQYRFPENGPKGGEPVTLDLFLATPETWGCIFLIRTGPSEFSHRLVTPKSQGGFCPGHLRFREGRIWDTDGGPMTTPEEADVLRFLGMDFIEPHLRK